MAKAKGKDLAIIPTSEDARKRIFEVRDFQVVIDSDLAEFYGVRTSYLTSAFERNSNRFPEDFAFRMTNDEWGNLKTKNSSSSWGGRRKSPVAFTEQGALQLAGLLKSERAALVSVEVSRAFVAMRNELASIDNHPVIKELVERMGNLEQGSEQQKEFNRFFKECFAELRPILEAVKDKSQDSELE